MKISESDSTMHAEGFPSRRTIAPWWHTGLMIALLLGTSVIGGVQARHTQMLQHRAARYAATLGWEWVLAALTYWGLRLRGTTLRELLGEKRAGARAWGEDALAALIFWIMSTVLLTALGIALRMGHMGSPAKTVEQLAPRTPAEVLLWIALSVTAGVCEEFLFRGYFLAQFASLRGALWTGVLASSLLFGVSHGYEGAAGMIAITAFGAMFCALVAQRRSLRAAMIAHAWHDGLTGILLALAVRFHVI